MAVLVGRRLRIQEDSSSRARNWEVSASGNHSSKVAPAGRQPSFRERSRAITLIVRPKPQPRYRVARKRKCRYAGELSPGIGSSSPFAASGSEPVAKTHRCANQIQSVSATTINSRRNAHILWSGNFCIALWIFATESVRGIVIRRITRRCRETRRFGSRGSSCWTKATLHGVGSNMHLAILCTHNQRSLPRAKSPVHVSIPVSLFLGVHVCVCVCLFLFLYVCFSVWLTVSLRLSVSHVLIRKHTHTQAVHRCGSFR